MNWNIEIWNRVGSITTSKHKLALNWSMLVPVFGSLREWGKNCKACWHTSLTALHWRTIEINFSVIRQPARPPCKTIGSKFKLAPSHGRVTNAAKLASRQKLPLSGAPTRECAPFYPVTQGKALVKRFGARGWCGLRGDKLGFAQWESVLMNE